MTDYRLDGLSTRTFEHLVQALALQAIANTVTPFGDGPDGGREATFNGPTNYGPFHAQWDGYGIIQAKFLQRPSASKADGTWIVRELTKELRKYGRLRRSAKTIDYYIVATNVTLTPAEDSGSKDKVTRILQEFSHENGLRGYDIWDYDKLRTLIDNNKSVRCAYAAWITPGDVLMQLSEWLTEYRSDYHRLVVNFLQKELLSDQYAKLEQAGHTADEAIPLAQVFIDLPIARRAYTTTDHHLLTRNADLQNFVSFIVEKAGSRLMQDQTTEDLDSHRGPFPGRIVLIGGPGQGKTTLGQYVCQIFRSSLLKDVPVARLDPDVHRLVQVFESKYEDGTVPEPSARRLPFRVVLSDFAAAMAEHRAPSLLTYLAELFSKRTNANLTPLQFQAMLTRYPSILVLDGLDEVPASSNRDQVLAAVRDFSVDIASSGMDVLVLATSRPQGYNEDFSSKTYDHRWLVPLPIDRALEYGTKLAQVRFAGDTDRIDKIVGRLHLASRTPATARIMRSPLQVTILTLLVDRRGQLPQERWALFNEYYGLIYQRETERDIPAAAILRDRKDDIDAVHRLVGLLLQVESEKSGGTDAKFTTAQFGQIVELYLASEGNEGKPLEELRDAIIEGAATRLVFLVGLESGEVGFEIRSLQEFMAAEGLLDASDALVQSRLRTVASNSNWRNVFLYAAGKVFAERRYLRDTVESICVDLNDDTTDIASRLVYAGSELALDLLEDGPVARQPAKSRSLTRLALRLLELDGSAWPRRLANIFQKSTQDIFEEELQRAFDGRRINTRRNAWICLGALAETEPSTFSAIAQRIAVWSPPDSSAVVEVVSACRGFVPDWLAEIVSQSFAKFNPAEIMHNAYRQSEFRARESGKKIFKNVQWLTNAWQSIFPDPEERSATIRLLGRASHVVAEVEVAPLRGKRTGRVNAISAIPSDCHPAWELIRNVAAFDESPSKGRLADVLRMANSVFEANDRRFFLPWSDSWPVQESLITARIERNGLALAEAAESGLLGDTADWESWEDRWVSQGVTLDVLSEDLSSIVTSGKACPWFPIRSGAIRFTGQRWTDVAVLNEMLDGKSAKVRKIVARDLVRFGGVRLWQPIDNLPHALVDTIMDLARAGSFAVLDEIIYGLRWLPPLSEDMASAFAEGGLSSDVIRGYGMRMRSPLGPWFASALRRFPHLHGLLVGIWYSHAIDVTDDDLYFLARLPLDNDPPVVRLSRAVVLLRSGRALDDVIDDVRAVFADDCIELDVLFAALGAEDVPVDRQIADLLTVRDLASGSSRREALAVSTLRMSLRRRQSGLIDEKKWAELGFMGSLREVTRLSTAD